MADEDLTDEEKARLEELSAFLLERPDARIREFLRRAVLFGRTWKEEGGTYSLSEISEAHNVSVRTLRRAIEAGTLKAAKLGKSYRVRPASLAEWIESRS